MGKWHSSGLKYLEYLNGVFLFNAKFKLDDIYFSSMQNLKKLYLNLRAFTTYSKVDRCINEQVDLFNKLQKISNTIEKFALYGLELFDGERNKESFLAFGEVLKFFATHDRIYSFKLLRNGWFHDEMWAYTKRCIAEIDPKIFE